MTRLALNLSGYVNGVARRHAETTERMFPGYRIPRRHQWRSRRDLGHTSDFAPLCSRRIFRTGSTNRKFWFGRSQLPEDEIWSCHQAAKSELSDTVKEITGLALNPDMPIIGLRAAHDRLQAPGCCCSLIWIGSGASPSAIPSRSSWPARRTRTMPSGKEAIAELHRVMQSN